MSAINPFENPELFDSFVVFSSKGRTTFPGVSTVEVHAKLNEDVKEIPGEEGATVTKLGYGPKTVTVTNKVWEVEQYHKIKEIIRLYSPRNGVAPEEMEVLHPTLELYEVTRLYIFELKNPTFKAGQGWVTTFEMREWWQEKKRSKTKGIGAGTPTDSFTDADIAALVSAFTATPPSEASTPPPPGTPE